MIYNHLTLSFITEAPDIEAMIRKIGLTSSGIVTTCFRTPSTQIRHVDVQTGAGPKRGETRATTTTSRWPVPRSVR
jgi:hypothetical protein